ncbi:hypothetical protein [Hyphomicrobium sp.]|uniref:hypothetical protein n=1 Tax=Hyphomicrobium sp. TaxID=82 RepID=UPI001326AACD|nr:hypothetical protein [Hyphomicrobium sp.]KAB2943132.1 MAG: hypothetical protein F9K20_03695 [Hyphomicrobium sp.]
MWATLRGVITLVVVYALAGCGMAQIEAWHGEQRTLIVLSGNELAHLRSGMRVYLESVQGIIEGLAENKMARVKDEARKAGVEILGAVPASTAVTLPVDFLMLSMDTHQKFDALSAAAAAGASKSEVLGSLRDILSNCTSCHARYRGSPNRP